MTSEPAPLDPNVATFCFYRRGDLCGFLASAPSPCKLCPNWRTSNESMKNYLGVKESEVFATWFDLPAPVMAQTGIQRTFERRSGYSLLSSEGDDAAAAAGGTLPVGAPAAAEPTGGGKKRGLEDWG